MGAVAAAAVAAAGACCWCLLWVLLLTPGCFLLWLTAYAAGAGRVGAMCRADGGNLCKPCMG